MEIAKLIHAFFNTLVWPLVIMAVILMFRKELKKLINRIKEVETPGGFKAKMISDEIKAQTLVEEINEELTVISKSEESETKQKEDIRTVLTEKIKSFQSENIQKPISITQNVIHAEQPHDLKNLVMLAFAVGDSQDENLEYGIYYDLIFRNNHTAFKYIGLYTDKTIIAVGELKKIVKCEYENNELVPIDGENLNNLTLDERDRLIRMMENAQHDVDKNHKFYFVDKFYQTSFVKISAYGIQSKKYFWLDEISGFREGMSAEELASLLNNKTWE